jgi:transposase
MLGSPTAGHPTKPAWGPHRNGFRWGTPSWGLPEVGSDGAFGGLRWQLNYKTCWQGGQLIGADRFFPSSKTCSDCGMVKAKLSLTERVFRCERCGLVIDRDVNAAKNLLVLAVSGRGPGGNAGHTAIQGSPRSCFAGC